jgi:hypothetical protein
VGLWGAIIWLKSVSKSDKVRIIVCGDLRGLMVPYRVTDYVIELLQLSQNSRAEFDIVMPD